MFDSQGIDTLFLIDSGELMPQSYTLDKAIFHSLSTRGTQINFSDSIDLVAVTGGGGENTWNVKQIPESLVVEFIGGSGMETLNGPNQDALWQIINQEGRHAVVAPATPDKGVAFSRIENLQAGIQNDVFLFEPGALPIDGSVDGGAGVNTLDYSAFTSSVYVNLLSQQTDLIDGSVTSFGSVIGGSGNDILVGKGSNILQGQGGRDVLIGGALASQLFGGDDEDILVAGTTDYDRDRQQLEAIRDFWSRTDLEYLARSLALQNGAGVPVLNADSVRANQTSDELDGQSALDLFFAKLGSDRFQLDLDEILVRLQ